MDVMPTLSAADPTQPDLRWWRHWQLWLLIALVAAIYLPRLTERPMRGEDSRRATIANEMFDTGNWIVPTQQHVPYLSRPPLHSWVMAGLSFITGSVDYLAIRLPSTFGVFGMAILVYAVSQIFAGRTAAFVGGAAIASMPQVMEMGREGETDVMFSCLVASSLLVWLAGYQLKWPRGLVWSLGYGLAALATLTKGVQALPYFMGATWVFLAWRRDWRWLFCWGQLAGLGVFAVVFGAWAVPFVRLMGMPDPGENGYSLHKGLAAFFEIFRKDSKDQWVDTSVRTVLLQLVTMPLKVAGSVMPWLSLLLLFLLPSVRRFAGRVKPAMQFLIIALLITWPTVWFTPTSKNRHYMPLYPCIAVMVAIVAATALSQKDDERPAKGWRAYTGIMGIVIIGIGVGFSSLALPPMIGLLARVIPRQPWADLQLPPLVACIFLGGSIVLGLTVSRSSRRVDVRSMTVGALAVAAFLGLLMVGPVQSLDEGRAPDIRPGVAQLKTVIGKETLVSYGPTAHLFAYYYRDYIPIVDLPKTSADPGAKVEYFTYIGGAEGIPEPKLPFAWTKVGEYCCDRVRSKAPRVLVVVGRRQASPPPPPIP